VEIWVRQFDIFLAVFPYFGSSILDLAITIKTGIILSPGSIHYQHLTVCRVSFFM